MRQLNVVHPPLVILFARLATIGRAARNAERAAERGKVDGQTHSAAGGDRHEAGGCAYDTANPAAAQVEGGAR